MLETLPSIVARRLKEVVLSRLQDESVVVLQGPRAVGKSTLLGELANSLNTGEARVEIVDLDDLATRTAAQADPALFVRGTAPIMIDEFQHVPELLDAIKSELNRDGSPGRFVLTGSTRYAALPATAQALTGRAHLIDVLPLSQGEITGSRENFASALLSDPRSLVSMQAPATPREEYIRRVVAGGFPSALRRASPASRTRWFDDYVRLVVERDVMDLSRVRQRRQLPLLLRQLASQTGQILNVANASVALGIEQSTTENYTKLLETVFLIQRLPAWGTTLGSRVAASPKIHMIDSGLASYLLRLSESRLAAASAQSLTEFGHLLETFVVGEICRQLDWLDSPVHRGHWRTRTGEEIDLILEREDGKVVAVEVKAGSQVRASELGSQMALSRKLGDQFLAGVTLYTGTRAYTHDTDFHVIPIDRLWRSTA